MNASTNGKGLYEGMKQEAPAVEPIQHAAQGDILPSTLALAAADLEFTQSGREYLLSKLLEPNQNKDLTIAGLLLTRFSIKTILNREMKEAIEAKAKELNAPIYETVIREGIAIKEAQTAQQSLFKYAPKSNAAIDYMDLINEYLSRGGQHE